jgi:very-short-patch-repair endonuclease
MAVDMHYGATRETFEIAERLRKEMTIAEKLLWERVCKKQLGVRIRRQHPIWKFVADFYCHAVRLAIEIDGDIHLNAENKFDDNSRGIVFKEFQIEVIRFTNREVLNEIDAVIEKVRSRIEFLKKKINAGAG